MDGHSISDDAYSILRFAENSIGFCPENNNKVLVSTIRVLQDCSYRLSISAAMSIIYVSPRQLRTVAGHKRGMADSTCKSPTCTNSHVYNEKRAVQKADIDLSRRIGSRKNNTHMMHSILCTCACITGSKRSLYMRGNGEAKKMHPT